MGTPDVTIVWFKRDLRIGDHRPLIAAAGSGGPVIPLSIAEPSIRTADDAHPAHWDFVRSCLVPLRDDLAATHRTDTTAIRRAYQAR
ncbi:deoxyribodipyrimidine photo-lyase [Ilumatobacter sp.]|uniref:deoxyribodipyrimidine photo-lyase n=1 Tax=Ilumatobacter sp. TaxID=1967498 RepID=UPI003751BE90